MIQVLKAGLCDTVQDTGRFGYASSGLGQSGPLDWFAAALANACLANNADAAVLEMHYPSSVLKFETPALIAWSGAGGGAQIDGRHISNNRLVSVNAGSELCFLRSQNNTCHYLAVKGGFAVSQEFNSRSTHLRAPLKGFAGRRLKTGDRLPIGVHINRRPQASFSINTHQVMHYGREIIKVLPGPDFHRLPPEIEEALFTSKVMLLPSRDRMGMRLQPDTDLSNSLGSLPSAPVEPGFIQLLPNGELALLLADAQTVGGYPRILQVTRSSLPVIVQKPSGSFIRFEVVSLDEALSSLQIQLDYISQIRRTSALLFYGL